VPKSEAENQAKVTLMKIAVVHHSLNIPGGAERLCLSIIEALKNEGHTVSLTTVEKTDWKVVQNNFGSVVPPNEENYLTTGRISQRLSSLPVSSLYFSIFTLQLLATRLRQEHNVIINTFGDAVDSIADITYVHFPLRAALSLSQIPAFTNESMWQTIAPIYDLVMSQLGKITPGYLLTNSKFTQGIIRTVLHRDSLVVYPPVNTETFYSHCFRDRKEGLTVAVVAGYTPKRHLEQVPLIAKHSKFAKFSVMGKADEYSEPILKKLKDSVSRLHVEDRVTLLENVPFKELLEALSEAKLYLHIMPHDHFGISVVEAMAAGCVPVVHRSGGPWTDILDEQQGVYGFSYSTAAEAAKYIDTLVIDEDLRSKTALRAAYRAKRFDKTVFMKRIVEVVEKFAG
jgi:alpha-1,2-mannosyltransferase